MYYVVFYLYAYVSSYMHSSMYVSSWEHLGVVLRVQTPLNDSVPAIKASKCIKMCA